MTTEELTALEEQASRGAVEAQYLAGCARHDDENPSLHSLEKARHWLTRAAEAGHAPAWRRLGYLALVEALDPPESLRCYLCAAERGDRPAAFSCAQLLAGRVAKLPGGPSHAAAIHWARLAAEDPDPQAVQLLAELLLDRDADPACLEEGATLLEQSARRSFLRAQAGLHQALEAGRLVPLTMYEHLDDDAPRFPWRPRPERLVPDTDAERLQALAREGSLDAIHDLGVLCYFDDDPRFARPPRGNGLGLQSAQRHYSFAANQGHPAAAFALGCIEVTEVGYKQLRTATDRFVLAARGGIPEAHEALDWLDRWGRILVRPL